MTSTTEGGAYVRIVNRSRRRLNMCIESAIFVYMRTNIEIDDKLMKDALEASKAKTKKEAVEIALRELVASRRRRSMLDLRGTIDWQSDLNEMRETRRPTRSYTHRSASIFCAARHLRRFADSAS